MEVIFSVLKRRYRISPKLSTLGITTGLSECDFSPHYKKWIILALTTTKQVLLRHWRGGGGEMEYLDRSYTDIIYIYIYNNLFGARVSLTRRHFLVLVCVCHHL